jgi:hypothetical protein
MAGLNVAFAVLSARLIVLVVVLGGIFLTTRALASTEPAHLVALAVYGVFSVASVWLVSRG